MDVLFERRKTIQPGQGTLICPNCENLIDGICSKASVADAYATGTKEVGGEFCSHYINPEWCDDDEEVA